MARKSDSSISTVRPFFYPFNKMFDPNLSMSTKNDHTEWTTSFNQEDMARRYKTAEAITRPFAKDMIERVGLLNPGLDNLIILDNACGTGIVAAALHDMLDDSTKRRMKLTCGDFAEPMLDACRKRIEENGWMHTEARKVDAQPD
ncbi:MAG: hypothetical protein L6R40_007122 [Gallowayella cf. fulva]|nr:MAG: hypothetical protein L6R40_007122 [Xanthomendoza cf. fulva]